MAAEFDTYLFEYVTDICTRILIPVRVKQGLGVDPASIVPGYRPRVKSGLACGARFNFKPRRIVAKRLDGNNNAEQFSFIVNRDQITQVVQALVAQNFVCIDLVGEHWPNMMVELATANTSGGG